MRYPRRSTVAAIHDVLMAACSLPVALYLRLGNEAWELSQSYILPSLLIFLFCFVCGVYMFRLQREGWRYVSINELKTIVKVVTVSIILTYGILFLFYRLENVPRSLPLLQWLVLTVQLCSSRILYRMLREGRGSKAVVPSQQNIKVLLAGAGNHAEGFIRAMQRDGSSPYEVVGIIDNDRAGQGRHVRGVKIVADIQGLERAITKLDARGSKPQRLILSDDYMDQPTVQHVLEICESQGICLARLPRLTDFTPGTRTDIKSIAIEDLLGRPQSHHDRDAMRQLIKGRRVLVTGAGGSIGSELVRQIARFSPAKLVLVDHSEYNLYTIDKELARKIPNLPRLPLLCDVRNNDAVRSIFDDEQPEIVFHAAALKHVPLAEINPEETILTNVFGTRNVAQACTDYAVQAMVLVSTDKAVHPVNVMGASKRLAEYVCTEIAKRTDDTRIVMVRFGNVLGSTGSVVPLFEEQLRSGGPITVTHPDMERYFMTIREASGLVIHAAALPSDDAALYILDMGEPMKITDLAEQMIRLAGYTPHDDIQISFTGLRQGEKLTEELIYQDEALDETDHPRISRSACMSCKTLDVALMDALEDACYTRNAEAALRVMQELVTDYNPQPLKDVS